LENSIRKSQRAERLYFLFIALALGVLYVNSCHHNTYKYLSLSPAGPLCFTGLELGTLTLQGKQYAELQYAQV
jgi:hypothetical protein